MGGAADMRRRGSGKWKDEGRRWEGRGGYRRNGEAVKGDG